MIAPAVIAVPALRPFHEPREPQIPCLMFGQSESPHALTCSVWNMVTIAEEWRAANNLLTHSGIAVMHGGGSPTSDISVHDFQAAFRLLTNGLKMD